MGGEEQPLSPEGAKPLVEGGAEGEDGEDLGTLETPAGGTEAGNDVEESTDDVSKFNDDAVGQGDEQPEETEGTEGPTDGAPRLTDNTVGSEDEEPEET